MTPDAEARPGTIEPFDFDKHNRENFSCGIRQIDNYFRRTANKLAKADNVRLYVMTEPNGTVIGFHAINAHAVSYEELPKKYGRTRPRHGDIPAAYISMIGRDRRYRGKGYGSDLLVDALKRIARAADEIGIAVVMLDVFDCGNAERTGRRKALYAGFGFRPLPCNEFRMFLPLATVRALLMDEAAEEAAAGKG